MIGGTTEKVSQFSANEVNLKQNFYFEEQSCTLNITEKMSLKLLY